MFPSLSKLSTLTLTTGPPASKRKRNVGDEESEEDKEERNVRLFRAFLTTGKSKIPTFDGSSIDPEKLLADVDSLLLGMAVLEDELDDAAWPKALISFVTKHPEYAQHIENMLYDKDSIATLGLSLSYICSWPSLSSWTDDELRFARFAVERAFSRSTDKRDIELGPQSFHNMPPLTFGSLWQERRMNCVLTIGDVVRMRETNTAIAVIESITQHNTTTFTWLTANNRMFSDTDYPIGKFYPYEPWKPWGTSVKWEDYDELKSRGELDTLLNAYAVSGGSADYWIKLSPELIGLAYGWMAQTARKSNTSHLKAPPSWLEAIEQGEPGAFPTPDAAALFGQLALKYAKKNF